MADADKKSSEISELIKSLESLTGQKVNLGKKINQSDSKKTKGAVGRPKKISIPILAAVVHQVLYKAFYEEMVIKGRSRPLAISKACDLLAKDNISRRNPELGVLRFLIREKSGDRALTKTEVVAGCANSIRRLFYLGIEESRENPLIQSKIQGVINATRVDMFNLIKP